MALVGLVALGAALARVSLLGNTGLLGAVGLLAVGLVALGLLVALAATR